MSEFLKLAGLLEEAAKALRQAQKQLDTLPSIPLDPLRQHWKTLPGYEKLFAKAKMSLRRLELKQQIATIADLVALRADDICHISGIGHLTMVALRAWLAINNLHFADEKPT